MVVVGITRQPEWNQYKVFWKDGNKDDEAKAYYTDDPEDAVNTLIAVLSGHPETTMTEARTTINLVNKYKPEYLSSNERRVAWTSVRDAASGIHERYRRSGGYTFGEGI